MSGGFRSIAVALALSCALAAVVRAQDAPPFLFLNQERILTGSRLGQELLAEEEAARDALRAEAREIDARFEAEERELTELRPTMAPEEFRRLADAFDERVVRARREQDERSAALAMELETRRRQFYAQVAPILVNLLSRYQAHAIFDETSVLLADQSLNITDAVIEEIDAAAFGDDDGGDDADPAPSDAPTGAAEPDNP